MLGLIGAFLLGVASGASAIIVLSCLAVSGMESEAERKREHTPEDND